MHTLYLKLHPHLVSLNQGLSLTGNLPVLLGCFTVICAITSKGSLAFLFFCPDTSPSACGSSSVWLGSVPSAPMGDETSSGLLGCSVVNDKGLPGLVSAWSELPIWQRGEIHLLQHFQEGFHGSLGFRFEEKSLVVGEEEVMFAAGVGHVSEHCKPLRPSDTEV